MQLSSNKGNAGVGVVIFVVIVIFVVVWAVGSSDIASQDASQKEEERVDQQQDVYVDSQPIPSFDWSLERHMFIELYKARNNAVTTYSYVRNWQGEVYFSCESIGFPLPANMQLTNPKQSVQEGGGGDHAIPQPEPNGLYTSKSSVGAYIFCVNDDGSVSPSYFEDKVEAHLSPLNQAESSLEGQPSLKIDTERSSN